MVFRLRFVTYSRYLVLGNDFARDASSAVDARKILCGHSAVTG